MAASIRPALAVALIAAFASTSVAANRLKDNDTDNLNLGSSWIGGAVPTLNDLAYWSNNLASANATLLGANLSFLGISVWSPGGAVAIGGNNTLTLGQGGIDMGRATQNLTISNATLALAAGDNMWTVSNGLTLTVSPTTFTRTPTSTLQIQGNGTVATTTGFFTNDTTGILGTWASHGAGTSMRYATVSGGNIVGYSGGTAAPTAAEVVDTTGASNYDVAAIGTFGGGVSFNTLRYTGAAGTNSGGFAANGLMNAGSGALTFDGNVTVGTNRTLVITTPDATRAITLAGTINDNPAGASGILKAGIGTVTLSGSNAYTGITTVNRGILRVTNPNALGSTNGYTDVYAGVPGSATGGQVQVSGSINVAEPFILRGDTANYTGAIRSSGGSNVLSGLLTIVNGSRIALDGGSQLAVIGGVTGLNQQIVINAGGSTIIFSEKPLLLGNSGSFYSDQSGLTILNTTNNTWGSTMSAGGTLRIDLPGALPTNSILRLGVGYSTSGTVDLNGNDQTVAGLQSGTAAGGERLATGTRTVTNSGPLATLTVNQANSSIYDGRLAGALALTKTGAATITLFGTNTHTGVTTISGGRLNLANSLAMQNSTVDLRVNNGAVFSNATEFVFGGLAGSGNLGLTNLTGSAITLLAGNNGADTVFSGSLGGSGGLTKLGAGELDLTGANTYSGATMVSNGLLSVNGRHTGGSAYTVASGATLGGTGLIDAAILVLTNGVVAPGNSIGSLTISNNFDLDGILRIELENAAGPGAGLSDFIDINGFFDITNGIVQFVYSPGLTNDHYVFAEYDTLAGDAFFNLDNLPSGYAIDYNYLGNKQIALVIPEPSTISLILIGAVLAAVLRRMRR